MESLKELKPNELLPQHLSLKKVHKLTAKLHSLEAKLRHSEADRLKLKLKLRARQKAETRTDEKDTDAYAEQSFSDVENVRALSARETGSLTTATSPASTCGRCKKQLMEIHSLREQNSRDRSKIRELRKALERQQIEIMEIASGVTQNPGDSPTRIFRSSSVESHTHEFAPLSSRQAYDGQSFSVIGKSRARLRQEIEQLRQNVKDLQQYISRITERALSHEGWEQLFASEDDDKQLPTLKLSCQGKLDGSPIKY
ncbi:hypothetical protein SJAG_03331 [Schizosaccharomyces japonicus yFS275]|uniref:Uncharacterized protein n=1 Tax=Schizosaccharomyces japonicus (strain yFS275 / FY16936) TaxID=402676 RepID=B6K3Y4_SCHJY|nr:hypothetical protein SJAG_03331 [Schizosaccharomyces japonicus yFS275]EEB08191.1 hypothetical protein SJAG_03331 [Schizosaccharomyces japonicus yFS275]